jgi:hypothetical protein
MRIKIISDGTMRGTHVVDRDTGDELMGVTSVHWEAKTNHMTRAMILLVDVDVEVVTDDVRLGLLSLIDRN